ARTCPLVPAEVVAIAPEPFPRRIVLAWRLDQPVPPTETASVEVETSEVPLENTGRPVVKEVAPVPPYAIPTEVVPTMVPFALVVRMVEGIWKSVVEPILFTLNSVDTPPFAEVEPMEKRLVSAPLCVEEAKMETSEVGEEEPTPTLPNLSIKNEVPVEEPTANAVRLAGALIDA